MVDEVEISNVGGPKGVASEATLAALVSAISKGDTARDRGLRLEGLARASNTREIKTSTKEQGILGKAIVGTASAAVGLGKEFLFGGNRLSDFSRAVFGADSAITSLVKYTDNLIDTYRELSSVGAGFNNSLFDFIKTSAMTGMSLGDFSDLVSQNSTRLRVLGSNVSDGAKRFGQISKTLRQDFGVGLSRVGFTMSDMNDVLLEYTDFSIRSRGKETRSNQQVAAAAANFGMELDQLSRLTGISRKQLAAEISAQTQDQRVRSAMSAMNVDQQKSFGIALGTAGKFSNNFKEALLDMVDGTPKDDWAKGLYTASETFRQQAVNIKNMDPKEQMAFFKQVAQEGSVYMNQFGTNYQNINNEMIRGTGDIVAELAQLAAMTPDDLALEGATDRVSAALFAFETALNNIKTNVLDAIISSKFGEQVKLFATELGDTISKIFGVGGSSDSLNAGVEGITKQFGSASDALFGEEGYLTGMIKSLRSLLTEMNASESPMELFKTKVGELGTNIKNWFMDMLLGTKTETRDRQETTRTGGLLQSISDGFSSLFNEGSILTTIKESISSAFVAAIEGIGNFWNDPANQTVINNFFTDMTDMFTRLINVIQDMFVNSSLAAFLGITDREDVTARQADAAIAARNSGGPVTKIDAENALNAILGKDWFNVSTIGLVGGSQNKVDPAIITELLKQVNTDEYWFEGSAIKDALQQLGDKYTAGNASEEEQRLFEQAASAFVKAEAQMDQQPVGATPPPPRSIGTLGATGLKFEPKDTVAQLHRGERVLSPEETAKYNSTGNQTMSNEKLDQLNNTMMRVAGLLDSALGVQTRTMKNVKSLGFDYYRGSPA